MEHPLRTILSHRHTGLIKGITSLCSANALVLEACMDYLKDKQSPLLIEATANQVNQDGGYTGMRPADFRAFVTDIAQKTGFPLNRLVLGGDHLGPLTWIKLPEAEAMAKAEVLVEAFVSAGFTKIHLDTSMRLSSDDPTQPLSTQTIARRGIRLMKIAENAYAKLKQDQPDALEPVYIVGSEVPIPGGAQEEEGISVTKPEDFINTVEVYQSMMKQEGLASVWPRILGVVVQPGVEFGDSSVHIYDRKAAQDLIQTLSKYPGIVFEGHSTDYQTEASLSQMVEDGIAILKVGPALTFALREGLFALSHIEDHMIEDPSHQSNFIQVLDDAMIEDPSNWKKHYHGTEEQLRFKRKFSYSDRCRYYLPVPKVEKAIDQLFANTLDIPISLLSQFMPIQAKKVRSGLLELETHALVKDWVKELLNDYFNACETKPE